MHTVSRCAAGSCSLLYTPRLAPFPPVPQPPEAPEGARALWAMRVRRRAVRPVALLAAIGVCFLVGGRAEAPAAAKSAAVCVTQHSQGGDSASAVHLCDPRNAGHLVVASGWYADTMASRGFGELYVSSEAAHPDATQAHGAGFVEGYLTAHAIAHLHLRVAPSRAAATLASKRNFVQRQHAFLAVEVDKHAHAERTCSRKVGVRGSVLVFLTQLCWLLLRIPRLR